MYHARNRNTRKRLIFREMKKITFSLIVFVAFVFVCSKCKTEDPKPPTTATDTTIPGVNTTGGVNTVTGATQTTLGMTTTTSTVTEPIIFSGGNGSSGTLTFDQKTLAGFNTYKNTNWNGTINQSSASGINSNTCNVPFVNLTTNGFVLDSADRLFLKLSSILDFGQYGGLIPLNLKYEMVVFGDSVKLQIANKDDCNPANINYVNYAGTIKANKMNIVGSDTLCCQNKLFYPTYTINIDAK